MGVNGSCYSTELFETFDNDVKRRIEVDLEGISATTRGKYMQYGVMPLIRFAHGKGLPVSMETLLEFSRELQRKGKGPGLVSSAFNGLKILFTGFQVELKWKHREAYLSRFNRHKRAFEARDHRTWTYPMSWDDIQYLLDKAPEGCDPETWSAFLMVGWVFLLRKNEIKRVNPSDFKIKRNGRNKVSEITLLVRNNKNSTNKKESKSVTFKVDQIPPLAMKILLKVAKKDSDIWLGLPHENKILPHLKQAMEGRYDESYYKVVIHSMRHGRAEDLHSTHRMLNEQICQLGRWSTTGGRNAYKHS